uniref:DNA-(apurinic or apyrimidinic site) endonuclease n=1 Tax=Glossina brevipalpis TaxID=37001 RepID=A0A1A9WXC9_9MUSC
MPKAKGATKKIKIDKKNASSVSKLKSAVYEDELDEKTVENSENVSELIRNGVDAEKTVKQRRGRGKKENSTNEEMASKAKNNSKNAGGVKVEPVQENTMDVDEPSSVTAIDVGKSKKLLNEKKIKAKDEVSTISASSNETAKNDVKINTLKVAKPNKRGVQSASDSEVNGDEDPAQVAEEINENRNKKRGRKRQASEVGENILKDTVEKSASRTTRVSKSKNAAKTVIVNRDIPENQLPKKKRRSSKKTSEENEISGSVKEDEPPREMIGKAAGKLNTVDNTKNEKERQNVTKKKSKKDTSEEKVDPKKQKTSRKKIIEETETIPENFQDEKVAEEKKVKRNVASKKALETTGRKRAAPSRKKDLDIAEADADVDDNLNEDETNNSKPTKQRKKTASNSKPLNATSTIYNKEDFELSKLDGSGEINISKYNLKISSWNVSGVRAWLKKDGLTFLKYEEPDIFCMQEIKCTTDQLPEELERIPGYHPYWLCKPGGYAGVAIYSKIMPINVEYGIGNNEFDDTGRVITAEYEKFFLINVYVPNSGRKLVNLESRMKWEKLFQDFVQKHDDQKPIIICGDMNVSHAEIDLANPKSNTRNAGFTKEEREKMTELLALGYVDTFRHLYPELKGAYTFWTYMANARARNVGWRLDYFLVSERFLKKVVDNCIRSQCKGSDHCPITLFLNL